MQYLLLVLILTGFAYGAWRLTRATSGPRPKVVGPDDDPDFLRRLNQDPDSR